MFAGSAYDVNLLKIISASPPRGELFVYESVPSGFRDQTFTIRALDGSIQLDALDPDTYYELLFFIKDGGEFDLDGEANGIVIDPVVLIGSNSDGESRREGGGGGCNAGLGFGALALIAALWGKRRK